MRWRNSIVVQRVYAKLDAQVIDVRAVFESLGSKDCFDTKFTGKEYELAPSFWPFFEDVCSVR